MWAFLLVTFLSLLSCPWPDSAAAAGGGSVEPDARSQSWFTLRRLTLQAGLFLPPYRPLSRAELQRLLITVAQDDSRALADPRERYELQALLRTLGTLSAARESGQRFGDADLSAGASAAAAGGTHLGVRAVLAYADFGEVHWGEAGYDEPAGSSARLELPLEVWWRRWWLSVTPRFQGRITAPGRQPPAGLLYPGWNRATGRLAVGEARRDQGAWRLDWPQAVAGVQLGRWSLSAGWAARRTGPGASGLLVLADTAPSFPAVTARRTAAFAWHGFLRHVAPEQLLLRCGRLSTQTVAYEDGLTSVSREAEPWFFQWLITFRHTSWLRTTITHGALAISRSGTLWPDILQINFPLLTATWAETDRGPVTDRIFALQFEARFRNAPWPLLPAAAGRLYWEYAGEDFRPNDQLKFLPEIAAPASVAGVELVSPRWDLACEYADLVHPEVLWYSHGNFREGYSHRGRLLGHPLGGSGRSLQLWLRWRPAWTRWELQLGTARRTWGREGQTPGRAEQDALSVALRRWTAAGRWELALQWNDESVVPYDPAAGRADRAEWVRVWLAFTR